MLGCLAPSAEELSVASPAAPDSIGYFGHCTVDSVTTAGGTVTTEIRCEHENDTLLPAMLEIAAAPEGDVVWKAGDKVVLEENAFDEGDGWRVYQSRLRPFLALASAAVVGTI